MRLFRRRDDEAVRERGSDEPARERGSEEPVRGRERDSAADERGYETQERRSRDVEPPVDRVRESEAPVGRRGVAGGRVVEDEDVVAPRGGYEETEVASDGRGFWHVDDVAGRVNAVLFAIFAAVEGLLGLRLAFVAFGANRSSNFVDFIMNVSWPFVRPFRGAFSDRTWDQGTIEVSTILAMGVILLAFILTTMLIAALLPHGTDDMSGGRRVRRHRVTQI